jgi:aromatic-L-amino-acid/L-tryptophan decarboxylase
MFHISIATAEDAAEILALQRLAYETEARLYNDRSIPPMTQTLESLIAEIKVATVLKATEGVSIIGSVRATLADEVCRIGRLMVDPARQGRGIGAALLRAIEDMFPQADAFELFTGSKSDGNIRLYTRYGYVVTGARQATQEISLVVLTKRRKTDAAETGQLQVLLSRVGAALDEFLKFEHPDSLHPGHRWHQQLDIPLPKIGIGIERVTEELIRDIIPNGTAIPRPGFSAFITTGGTTAAALAATAANVAAPQRASLTAFNLLEEVSLKWLASMCGVGGMQGVYSSGGSTANLLALGAARQFAFEQLGRDVAAQGIDRPVAVYATAEAHHTIQRAAGVLGLGRRAVRAVACDGQGRMDLADLRCSIAADQRAGVLPMAVVANAGTTNTGAIDPIKAIGELARSHGIWLHVDGAYGLPGILDERKAALYEGLELADSAIVDPHKWLGASVGIAATFVRDRQLLLRAFTQEPAAYLEGTIEQAEPASPVIEHSMDDFGIPYYDYGVELSAPSRGVVVWALIREIGVDGMRARIRRHNDMAAHIAQLAREHPNLELLLEPTLSICCFRYVHRDVADLDRLNRQLHRRLVRENRNLPSTTRVAGALALRPCFIGARATLAQADSLVEDVLRIGTEVAQELTR